MTDDPNQMMPPMKHEKIAGPKDTQATILRLLREQEDRLDRIGAVSAKMAMDISNLRASISWTETFAFPVYAGILGFVVGILIGWSTA